MLFREHMGRSNELLVDESHHGDSTREHYSRDHQTCKQGMHMSNINVQRSDMSCDQGVINNKVDGSFHD